MTDYSGLLSSLNEYQRSVVLCKNHRYTKDGKYKPGVTTVIKVMDAPALDDWKVRVQVEGTARAAYKNPPLPNEPLEGYVARMKKLGEDEKEHERLSEAAADVGKGVHSLIEHEIRSMLGQETAEPDVCHEALFRFAGWRQWALDVGLKPLAAESRLYNTADDYCGTSDALVLINGVLTLLDWKPEHTLYPERRLQLAAYRKSLESMGWPPMRGAIVCIPRDGGDIQPFYSDDPGPDLDATYQAFLALLKVYHWRADVRRREREQERAA